MGDLQPLLRTIGTTDIGTLYVTVDDARKLLDEIERLREEHEMLIAALKPFAAVGSGIPDNWPSKCALRIDAREDGSEYLSYHGTPEMEQSQKLLPTLQQWRVADILVNEEALF